MEHERPILTESLKAELIEKSKSNPAFLKHLCLLVSEEEKHLYCIEKQKLPKIFYDILNLFNAIVRHINNRFAVVSDETFKARLEVCKGCPELIEAGNCRVCGCVVGVKAKWASEDCPLKKWPLPVININNKKTTGKGGCGCGK